MRKLSRYLRKLESRSMAILQRRLRPHGSNQTAGFIVETFGTSGIGKSTLLDYCRWDLFPTWARAYPRELQGRTESLDPTFDDCYRELLHARLNVVQGTPMSAIQQARTSRYNCTLIILDALARASDAATGVFLDEGLVQHFNRTLLTLDEPGLTLLLSRRGFVHLTSSSPELVLRQIRLRQSRARSLQNPHHLNLDDAAILERTAGNLRHYTDLATQLSSRGCPVLTIFAENGLRANRELLRDFMKTHLPAHF